MPSDDPDVSIVATDINVPLFAAVLNGALSLYDEAVAYWLGHAGFPRDVWKLTKGL